MKNNKGRIIVMAVLALLIISPLDIIPDFIPLAGQLDDVVYALGIATQAIRLIRERRAQNMPAEDIIGEPRWYVFIGIYGACVK